MTPTQLRRIRTRLVTFAESIFEPIPRKDQRARGETYLRGLLLDGKAQVDRADGHPAHQG